MNRATRTDSLRARPSATKTIACIAGKKSYDRTIGRCTLDGKPFGDLMRAAGAPEGGR
jgi:endonuclease YncB( thermonuclease family)